MSHSPLAKLFRRKVLLIFDFDGTIVDSSPLHERAFNEAFSVYGVAVNYAALAGLTTDTAVDKVSAEAGLRLNDRQRTSLIMRKRDVARRLIGTELAPIEGSLAFIKATKQRYQLALCTSGSRGTVEIALDQVGLTGTFDPLIAAEDVINGKPDPEGFLKALEYHRTPADRALVFEDADSGLAAAAAAGIDAIRIVPQGSARESFQEADWFMLNEALAKVTAGAGRATNG